MISCCFNEALPTGRLVNCYYTQGVALGSSSALTGRVELLPNNDFLALYCGCRSSLPVPLACNGLIFIALVWLSLMKVVVLRLANSACIGQKLDILFSGSLDEALRGSLLPLWQAAQLVIAGG